MTLMEADPGFKKHLERSKKKEKLRKICKNVSREILGSSVAPRCCPMGASPFSLRRYQKSDVSQLETQHDSALTSQLARVATKPRKPAATVVSEHSPNTTNGRPSKPRPSNFYEVDALEATTRQIIIP
jgi:hypothetical protein